MSWSFGNRFSCHWQFDFILELLPVTEVPLGKLGLGSTLGSTCSLTASVIGPVLNTEHLHPPLIPLKSAPLPPQTPPIPPCANENSQEENGGCHTRELSPSTDTRKPTVEPDRLLER